MRIIAGLYKGRTLIAPKGSSTRPTSGRLREALFNICQWEIEGVRFLDLFAGSGAMGFEALSRGAHSVTFVDNNRECIRSIQENAQKLGVDKAVEIVFGDVNDTLHKLATKGRSYGIIYADPPYGTAENSYSQKVLTTLNEILQTSPKFLLSEGSLFLEDASESLPKLSESEHLILSSEREAGRSALQHYRRKPT